MKPSDKPKCKCGDCHSNIIQRKGPYLLHECECPSCSPPDGEKELGDLSLCPSCHCMTYTVKGICGKCREPKPAQEEEKLNYMETACSICGKFSCKEISAASFPNLKCGHGENHCHGHQPAREEI